MNEIFAYLILIFLVVFVILSFWYGIEVLVAIIKKIPPRLNSGKKLRETTISELKKLDFKTIVDIGSGYGGLAGLIGKNFPDAKVYGFEIMPMPYIYSKIWQFFGSIPKNVKLKRADAFKEIKKSKGFDVGVCYTLSNVTKRIENEVLDKFKYLIVLDFPLPILKPIKTVKLHHDPLLGQHNVFVYKV